MQISPSYPRLLVPGCSFLTQAAPFWLWDRGAQAPHWQSAQRRLLSPPRGLSGLTFPLHTHEHLLGENELKREPPGRSVGRVGMGAKQPILIVPQWARVCQNWSKHLRHPGSLGQRVAGDPCTEDPTTGTQRLPRKGSGPGAPKPTQPRRDNQFTLHLLIVPQTSFIPHRITLTPHRPPKSADGGGQMLLLSFPPSWEKTDFRQASVRPRSLLPRIKHCAPSPHVAMCLSPCVSISAGDKSTRQKGAGTLLPCHTSFSSSMATLASTDTWQSPLVLGRCPCTLTAVPRRRGQI